MYRIGVSVLEQCVTLVVVSGDRVTAEVRDELPHAADLGELVGELIRRLSLKRRLLRPPVRIALGPALSQLRLITGLPKSSDPRLHAAIIAREPRRFFLGGEGPQTTTNVRVESPGRAWAAALDGEFVENLVRACESQGLRVELVVPAESALAHWLPDGVYHLPDRRIASEFRVAGRQLAELRRVPVTEPPQVVPIPGPLSGRGVRSVPALLAYAAALAKRSAAPAYSLPKPDTPLWRIAAAAGIGTAALGWSLLAPTFELMKAERQAAAELAALASERRSALQADAELGLVTAALQEISAFAENRRSAVGFLSSIARALPDSAAIVTVKGDSVGGSIVLLAPRGPALLKSLEQIEELTNLKLTSPITREEVGGIALDRVALGFEWRRSP